MISLRPGAGPGHDRGRLRGRGPDRAELDVRPCRPHRRPAHHLPADLQAGRPGARGRGVLHAQARHRDDGQRLPPQLQPVARDENILAEPGRHELHLTRGGPARARRRARATPPGAMADHRLDRQLLQALLGRRSVRAVADQLGPGQQDLHGAAVRQRPARVQAARRRGQPLPVARRPDRRLRGRAQNGRSTRASRPSGRLRGDQDPRFPAAAADPGRGGRRLRGRRAAARGRSADRARRPAGATSSATSGRGSAAPSPTGRSRPTGTTPRERRCCGWPASTPRRRRCSRCWTPDGGRRGLRARRGGAARRRARAGARVGPGAVGGHDPGRPCRGEPTPSCAARASRRPGRR